MEKFNPITLEELMDLDTRDLEKQKRTESGYHYGDLCPDCSTGELEAYGGGEARCSKCSNIFLIRDYGKRR